MHTVNSPDELGSSASHRLVNTLLTLYSTNAHKFCLVSCDGGDYHRDDGDYHCDDGDYHCDGGDYHCDDGDYHCDDGDSEW